MKTAGRGLFVAAALALSGCGQTERKIANGTDCYPEAARPWIAAGAAEEAGARDPGGKYAVYVDGSASMSGYLSAATPTERPLNDLIGMLPQLPGIVTSGVELVRFDRKVTLIGADDMRRLQTVGGYMCSGPSAGCDAQESHVDQALARIAAADKTTLSVVVSDLWLTNSEVLTSGGVALSKPLTEILTSGRDVAIYGFESPYAGRLYDLPSGSKAASARRRYLFVVAVGAPRRIDAFHVAMTRAPSAGIAGDLSSGRGRFSLFTTEPVRREASGTQSFGVPPSGALTKATFLPVRQGVRVPQFRVDRADGLKTRSGEASAAWSGVSPSQMRPGAVWTGPSRGETEVFRMSGEACRPDGGDWRPEGRSADGWAAQAYSLDPSELASMPRGSYLLVGNLRRTGLESPNPAAAWMRDWSLDAASERSALARRVVPTLNLGETARLMENALAQAAEARPIKIGGFAAAVQID